MSYWTSNFGEYKISTMDQIYSGFASLEEILLYRDTVEEVRKQNPTFIDILIQRKNLFKLVEYITVVPDLADTNVSQDRLYKYPFYSTEVMCIEHGSLANAILLDSNRDIFDRFLSFLSQPAPLNTVLAGYFFKVLTSLFSVNFRQCTKCLKTKSDGTPRESIIDLFLNHVESKGCVDALVSMIIIGDADLSVLPANNIGNSLIEKLNISSMKLVRLYRESSERFHQVIRKHGTASTSQIEKLEKKLQRHIKHLKMGNEDQDTNDNYSSLTGDDESIRVEQKRLKIRKDKRNKQKTDKDDEKRNEENEKDMKKLSNGSAVERQEKASSAERISDNSSQEKGYDALDLRDSFDNKSQIAEEENIEPLLFDDLESQIYIKHLEIVENTRLIIHEIIVHSYAICPPYLSSILEEIYSPLNIRKLIKILQYGFAPVSLYASRLLIALITHALAKSDNEYLDFKPGDKNKVPDEDSMDKNAVQLLEDALNACTLQKEDSGHLDGLEDHYALKGLINTALKKSEDQQSSDDNLQGQKEQNDNLETSEKDSKEAKKDTNRKLEGDLHEGLKTKEGDESPKGRTSLKNEYLQEMVDSLGEDIAKTLNVSSPPHLSPSLSSIKSDDISIDLIVPPLPLSQIPMETQTLHISMEGKSSIELEGMLRSTVPVPLSLSPCCPDNCGGMKCELASLEHSKLVQSATNSSHSVRSNDTNPHSKHSSLGDHNSGSYGHSNESSPRSPATSNPDSKTSSPSHSPSGSRGAAINNRPSSPLRSSVNDVRPSHDDSPLRSVTCCSSLAEILLETGSIDDNGSENDPVKNLLPLFGKQLVQVCFLTIRLVTTDIASWNTGLSSGRTTFVDPIKKRCVRTIRTPFGSTPSISAAVLDAVQLLLALLRTKQQKIINEVVKEKHVAIFLDVLFAASWSSVVSVSIMSLVQEILSCPTPVVLSFVKTVMGSNFFEKAHHLIQLNENDKKHRPRDCLKNNFLHHDYYSRNIAQESSCGNSPLTQRNSSANSSEISNMDAHAKNATKGNCERQKKNTHIGEKEEKVEKEGEKEVKGKIKMRTVHNETCNQFHLRGNISVVCEMINVLNGIYLDNKHDLHCNIPNDLSYQKAVSFAHLWNSQRSLLLNDTLSRVPNSEFGYHYCSTLELPNRKEDLVV